MSSGKPEVFLLSLSTKLEIKKDKMFSTFISTLDETQSRLVKFISYQFLVNGKKISAISMAMKLTTFAFFFALVPMGTIPGKALEYRSNVQLDKNSVFAIKLGDAKTSLEVGESTIDRETREKIIAEARVEQVAVETVSHTDPSDFRPIYMDAARRFGIPWQLIEAVHEVESGKSGSTSKRSYAGAQGPMQFMPGTWRAYAIDGDGDGSADATNVVDALYGAANLLASSGAAEGNIDGALFNYNHAQWYVDKVKAVAYEIGM